MLKIASMVGGSSLVRGAIIGQVTDRITGAAAGVTQQALAWSELNWPVKQVGMLHFDLAELKEKRSEEVYQLVLNFTRWLVFILCMLVPAVHFVAPYSPPSMLSHFAALQHGLESPDHDYPCECCQRLFRAECHAVLCRSSHWWRCRACDYVVCVPRMGKFPPLPPSTRRRAATRRSFLGSQAENAGRSKTIARVGCVLLFVFCLVLAFVFGGNVNGLSGLGATARFDAAAAG